MDSPVWVPRPLRKYQRQLLCRLWDGSKWIFPKVQNWKRAFVAENHSDCVHIYFWQLKNYFLCCLLTKHTKSFLQLSVSVLYMIESSLLLFWELMNTPACTRCCESTSSHPPCNSNVHCLFQTKGFLSSYFFICDIPCILLFFHLLPLFLILCVMCLLLLS